MNDRVDNEKRAPNAGDATQDRAAEEKQTSGSQAQLAKPARVLGTPWQWRTAETPEECLARIQSAPNPLLEAAQPLLRALAEMPAHLPGVRKQEEQEAEKERAQGAADANSGDPSGPVVALRFLLAEELKRFQQLCERANVRRDHILGAHYLLCTALDEAAHNKNWGEGGWPLSSLLVSLHQDNRGGERSFHVLGRLVTSPEEHLDLIELFYQVLSLGFSGRYGADKIEGHQRLEAIRQRLLNLLSGKREEVPRELSPHWRGESAGKLSLLRSLPVWVIASVLALGAFGLFAWFKYQLLFQAHDVEQEILSIGKITPPEPPKPPKALRLAELLRGEIARGVVSVKEDATRSDVTFRGDDMFGGGRADVSPKILPVLDKVAAEINNVSGKVTVIGHSDNIPIKTAKFPSNQALSEERATTVIEYLTSKGLAKSRLEAIGKGDSEPVADNKTPAGRAKNRRVEIIVTQ